MSTCSDLSHVTHSEKISVIQCNSVKFKESDEESIYKVMNMWGNISIFMGIRDRQMSGDRCQIFSVAPLISTIQKVYDPVFFCQKRSMASPKSPSEIAFGPIFDFSHGLVFPVWKRPIKTRYNPCSRIEELKNNVRPRWKGPTLKKPWPCKIKFQSKKRFAPSN